MENGKWKVESGKWKVENGKWNDWGRKRDAKAQEVGVQVKGA